jgi:hypothetical protein
MTIPFWTNDPLILFNKDYIFELWPNSNMSYEQKLNAITRVIIIITILGYVLTMSLRILLVGFVTLILIFALYKMRKQKLTANILNEGFMVSPTVSLNNTLNNTSNTSNTIVNPVTLESVLKSEYKEGNKKNPFSNVLLTQISDEPDRKPAPPAFNPDVEENITKNTKRAVQFMNSGIKNTNKQLYGDLWEKFELDQSNRAFYSTANTKVCNDQGAYAEYLYGNMPSGKSSGPDGDFARVQDNYRYTLY